VPKKLVDVPPDLSGIDMKGVTGSLAIADIRIDKSGAVKEVCVLRGLRDDVDDRAADAFRQWRYEPPALRHDERWTGPVDARGQRVETITPAGTLFEQVITVTVSID
jgi:hypothetical protein